MNCTEVSAPARWSMINRATRADPALTKHRSCPICSDDGFETLLLISDFQFFNDLERQGNQIDFRVVQCRRCDAAYTNPVYSREGFSVLFALAGRSYGFHKPDRMDLIAADLAQQLALPEGGSILDVGCGTGALLRALPVRMQRIGVDVDRYSIEQAVQQSDNEDIRFICADFDALRLPESPDCICMLHVLEHLPNPLATLRNLHALAHDDTRLVVEVPVLENSATNDINGFFSVQHLTHFSENSLYNMLARAGWKIMQSAHQLDYRGYRIYAQRSEPTAELRPAANDRLLVQEYLAGWYQSLARINKRLDEALASIDSRNIVLWGAGLHSEILYHFVSALSRADYRFLLADSDPRKVGGTWRGVPIIDSSRLSDFDWNPCALLLSSYGGQPAMRAAALSAGVPESRIIQLYKEIRVY